MVGNFEGTVGNYEKTVAFINATNYLKEEKGIKFVEVGELLGLNKGQMNMIRIKRRHISKKEIDTLLNTYPDLTRFFKDTIFEHEKQTLNEPMSTHFYSKQNDDPWKDLVDTQRKLIAKLEEELAETKDKLRVVEAEKKTLVEIVSQRK